jgi:hypothetical protein
MRRTQCETDPRSSTSGDVVRRVADYAAGYADAEADHDDVRRDRG